MISEPHAQKDHLLSQVVVLIGTNSEVKTIGFFFVAQLHRRWIVGDDHGVVKRAALLSIRQCLARVVTKSGQEHHA